MSRPLPPLRPYVNGVQSEDVRFPRIGELVLIRLPFDMPGPTSVISSSAISGSNNRNYHPCVVIGMVQEDNDWQLRVYICRSFSEELDPVSYVRSLPLADRNLLLPIPHNPRPDTPLGFGAPLSFSNYISQRPGWLIANPIIVNMGGDSPYKPFQPQALLPSSERIRIKAWHTAVSVTNTTVLPPGAGGAGGGATRGAGDDATGGAGSGGAGGPYPAGGDGGIKGAADGPGPMYATTQLGLTFKNRAVIVLESPQGDDDDDDDAYSEVHFSLEDFKLAAAQNDPYYAMLVARREAEHRNIIQQWIMSL